MREERRKRIKERIREETMREEKRDGDKTERNR